MNHFLALAIVVGNIVSVTVVYDCEMSGRRTTAGCCCSATGQCPDEASALQASAANVTHEVRSTCCSLSLEKKGTTGPAVRLSGETAWKAKLEHSRAQTALLVCIPAGFFEATVRFHKPTRHERSPPPVSGIPIFLAHFALLI